MRLFLLSQTSHEVNIQFVVILSIINSYNLLEMFPEHTEPGTSLTLLLQLD